jgi:carbamate kinase
MAEKHLTSGSMEPNVQAITKFFKASRNRGIIRDLKHIQKAIDGYIGTESV